MLEMMEVTTDVDRFEELKRKFYLCILPLLIFAVAMSLSHIDDTKQINIIILQLLLVSYSISWILLYLRKWILVAEISNLALISIIHLIVSFDIFHSFAIEITPEMSSSSYWTPLVYIFIFVTIRGKQGLIYSLCLWIITVFFGIYYWDGIPQPYLESAFHYYLSILVYIIFMYFASSIISAFAESHMLEKFAYQDQLTKISNRRKIYELLDNALKKQVSLSIIFFDLDHFKKINDVYGHLVGDKVLIEVTSLVQNHLFKDDDFGRWGGEEFMIISYTKTKEDMIELAETLRQEIEENSFASVHNITSSFGIADSVAGDTTETIIDRADQALYISKQQGRNQVSY
ncbi:GGDEF domain-containing protein [Radiobacillus sp. PE A8.2]|uniref:GGDEF domain-containing protein n=1 Tax=Radiobacillus sp. PE A8.2 TaxID=3380349 RepID=UPI00388F63F7